MATPNKKEYRTNQCVRCGKKATVWYGFVLSGETEVLAGWCGYCNRIDDGFMGCFHDWMGKVEDV